MIKQLEPIHLFTVENARVHLYYGNVGDGLQKHDHVYSHVTACTSGRLIIRKENVSLEMTKDTQPVSLKQLEWHEIEILEDNTSFSNIFKEL